MYNQSINDLWQFVTHLSHNNIPVRLWQKPLSFESETPCTWSRWISKLTNYKFSHLVHLKFDRNIIVCGSQLLTTVTGLLWIDLTHVATGLTTQNWWTGELWCSSLRGCLVCTDTKLAPDFFLQFYHELQPNFGLKIPNSVQITWEKQY